MTETEKKALALVTQLQEEDDGKKYSYAYHFEALCRAIEQHEAFRQEVSDALEKQFMWLLDKDIPTLLRRFIIAKPDPLVEVFYDVDNGPGWNSNEDYIRQIRAAIEARGGRIVWEGE